MKLNKTELKEFLDTKVSLYNNPKFIDSDPIKIPHKFSKKEDIEISGFLTATIAWGNRTMIIKNSQGIVELMDMEPYDFVMNCSEKDLEKMSEFVHRTFNSVDLKYFVQSLRNIYVNHGGMEQVFANHQQNESMQNAIHEFKKVFTIVYFFEKQFCIKITIDR